MLYGWNTVISIHGSQLFNNSAARSGGAIYAEKSIVNISQSRFNMNEASKFGGALYINEVVLTIKACTFSKNAAICKGNETTMTMSGRELLQDTFSIKCPRYHTSAGFGGAIAGIGVVISFDKTIKLEQNIAAFGGAIFIHGSRLSIYTEAIIINNVAANSGGALFLDSSNIVCLERCLLELENNTARVNGGGAHTMMSNFIIDHDTAFGVYFTNNRAEKGGGVYFESNSFFIVITESILNPSAVLNFTSNKAQVGRALYVPRDTFWTTCSFPILRLTRERFNDMLPVVLQNKSDITITRHRRDCLMFDNDYLFDESVNIQNSIFYASTAIEVKLCFCVNDNPNCSYQHPPIFVKKGQEFSVPVVTVDWDNTSINASVRASISPEGGLAVGQIIQTITYCTDLVYNVYSPHASEQLKLIVGDSNCSLSNTRNLKVYIQFLPCSCPIGFQPSPSEEANCKCVCDPVLFQYIRGCNLQTQSVIRATDAWIAYEIGSESLSNCGYIIHPICPYDYCIPASQYSEINLNLPNGSNAQCDHNRAGILCGSCLPGHSLSLGGSNCIRCMNYWPATCIIITIIAFLAGFVLLLILHVLDLTVKVGTINGLIFYANIVHAFKSTFLPHKESTFATVFTSWLNFEFGIDMCFFEGMDAYSKIWIEFFFPSYVLILNILIIHCTAKCCTRSKICNFFLRKISNSGPVLATVIFLFVVNLLTTASEAISFVRVKYMYPDSDSEKYLWILDANIPYLEGKHIGIFFVSIVIYFLSFMYSFYLLFGRHLFKCCRCSRIIGYNVRIFLQQLLVYYHAPFANKFQFWSGLLLLIRIILHLVSLLGTGFGKDSKISVVSIITATIVLMVIRMLIQEKGLYKRSFVEYLEIASYVNLSIFAVITLHVANTDSQASLANVSVSVAFTLFVIILIDRFYAIFWQPKRMQIRELLMALWRQLKKSLKETTIHIPLVYSRRDTEDLRHTVTFDQFREPLLPSPPSHESSDSWEIYHELSQTRGKTNPGTIQVSDETNISQNTTYAIGASQPLSVPVVISTQESDVLDQQRINSPASPCQPEEEKAIRLQDRRDEKSVCAKVSYEMSSENYESQNGHSKFLSKSSITKSLEFSNPFQATTSKYSHPQDVLSADYHLNHRANENDRVFLTALKSITHNRVLKYFKSAENVASVPFVDEITVLAFDSSGKECTNIDHDITLKVPENAIPQGSVVHFEVAVALYGPFNFPEGRMPISPILWICQQEGIALRKPIEVVLPHILNNRLTNEDISRYDLQFYKADHTDYIIEPNRGHRYVFRPLDDDIQFMSTKDDSYGVLRTTHCCFLCITAMQNAELSQDMALKKGYCLSCIECLQSPYANMPPRDIVYFCTSFFLKTCLKVSLSLLLKFANTCCDIHKFFISVLRTSIPLTKDIKSPSIVFQ